MLSFTKNHQIPSMKKISALSPLFLCALAAAIHSAFLPEAFAFGGPVGGPSTNGSYFPNVGTFSAVIRGKNLVGTAQFSTTDNAGSSVFADGNDYYHSVASLSASAISTTGGIGSTGVSVIYNEGQTYRGNSNGIYDPSANEMTVMFQGSFPGQGEQIFETVVEGTENSVNVKYFDAFYINGAAICSVINDYPNQTFKGEGQANINFFNFDGSQPLLQGNDQTLVETGGSASNPTYSHRVGYDKYFKPINVTGVRVSNTASTFATATVVPPSFNKYLGLPVSTPTATPTPNPTATPTPTPNI
jgi:hypothetical protein